MFTTNFNNYACVNDSITCTIGKYEFTATIEYDYENARKEMLNALN